MTRNFARPIRTATGPKPRTLRKHPFRFKPRLEILEHRRLLSAETLFAHVGNLVSFDVHDLSDIQQQQVVYSPAIPGEGITFDKAGNLYAGVDGLDIFDRNLNLIGQAPVNDPISSRAMFVAWREPGQVFACNPVRTPFARLFVFDTQDLQHPTLTHIVNIPFTDNYGGSECRGLKFDAEGHLWVTAYSQLIELTVDAEGNPIAAEDFGTYGNPLDVAFQPGSGRIFYSAVNSNLIGVLDPSDPNLRIATITNVTDNAINSPGAIAFDSSGNLFVSGNSYDGATTDIVAFRADTLTSLTGEVDASTLSPSRIASPDLDGGGWLAIRPSLPSTFTVRLVDQFGAEIAGSAISVPGVGLVATGTKVTVPDGNVSFGLIPKILDTDPFTNGEGLLNRTEIRAVDSSTSSIDFVWPVEQVQLNLLDQFGQPITGINGQPSRFLFFGSAVPLANGSVLALPITDDTAFPNAVLSGAGSDGYDITMAPAILDIDPLCLHCSLSRGEFSGTTEVTSSTSALSFEWPVEQVQLNLLDQFGQPITGINGQPSRFLVTGSAVPLANGSIVALPITDETALPNADLRGIFWDGYDIAMAPAILDIDPLCLHCSLSRGEFSSTTEITSSTSGLSFVWPVEQMQLNLLDQDGIPISGINGQPSRFLFSGSAVPLANGSVVALPITDENALPNADLRGIFWDGYDIAMAPAILDIDPVCLHCLLSRTEVSGTTEVATSASALNFTWITIHGPLREVDGNGNEILNSAYAFSNSGQVLPTGSCVSLPITDPGQYPTLDRRGIWADGYDVFIRPDGASSFSGSFNLALATDGSFSPQFVTIAGSSVGLKFGQEAPPLVTAGLDANIVQGTAFTSSGAFQDLCGRSWTATVDYGDSSGVQPLTLNPDKTFALVHSYLNTGSFTVTVAVTNEDGATGSDTATVTVLPLGTPGKITGGGSVDSGVRNFGFVAMTKTVNGVMTFHGNLEFQDKSKGYNLHSTAITLIRVEPDGKHGSFEGTATVNGASGYSFKVSVEDNAEPGAGVDRFRIQISGPSGFSYDSSLLATEGGLLDMGGNIQIHRAGSSLTAAGQGDTNSNDSATTADSPALVRSVGQLLTGVLLVSVEAPGGNLDPEQLARIRDALTMLNDTIGSLGVTLVEADAADSDSADVGVQVADTSECGGLADGVLGCTTSSGEITLVAGWNWYVGADAGAVEGGQYDFQTIITHELGHSLGLGHSHDAASVMYESLAAGVARRGLTANDLGGLAHDDDDGVKPEPLLASSAAELSVVLPTRTELAAISRALNDVLVLPTAGSHGHLGSDLPPHDSRWHSMGEVSGPAGSRNDVLLGGGGDDLMIGGHGQDVLIGGFSSASTENAGANHATLDAALAELWHNDVNIEL